MIELFIPLLQEGGQYLYQQIYDYIKKEIISGKLFAGERLPSARLLASQLQVSRSTVDLAYEQLVSEGYIESIPCKGFYVCEVEDLYKSVQVEKKRSEVVAKTHKIRIDCSPNKLDQSFFPMETWKKISRTVLANDGENLLELGDHRGEALLRDGISRYLHNSRGVNCESDQIIIGAGSDYLLLLLQRMLGRSLTLAIENPSYQRAYEIFYHSGYNICPIELDGAGILVDLLEDSKANVAYVTPSRQFPTGIVMPIGRRSELLKWATRENERFIIEDDYDSEFRYKGKPIPSLQGLDTNGRVIYLGTFSKSIAPSLRVSYMVLPPDLMKLYQSTCSMIPCSVPRIDQIILQEFMLESHYERYLNKMRKIYKSKHDYLFELLSMHQKYFKILGESGGLHFLLEEQYRDLFSDTIVKKCEEQGLKIYQLSDYDRLLREKNVPEYRNTIVFGYASLTKRQMKEAVEILVKCIKKVIE